VTGFGNYGFGQQPFGLPHLVVPTKRGVFVSYHHDGDQTYYDTFSDTFNDTYEVIRDNSVDRKIDSEDPEYVMRRIREEYIAGTSCTIVLCGAMTPLRKYVDWEIKASLDKQHGLIGVNLPTNPPDSQNRATVPNRLYDNWQSGYALWVQWNELSANNMRIWIEQANQKPSSSIRNDRPLRSRNG